MPNDNDRNKAQKLQTEIDIKAPLPPPPPPFFDDTRELSFFKPRSRRHRGDTWMVSVFLILHVAAFAVTMFVNDCWRNSDGDCAAKFLGRFSFQPISENPLLGPSASMLDEMGALRRRFITQTWRLFAFPCLHGGLIHLVINLSGVVLSGIHLEREFGPLRVGIIYVLSALSGSVVASLFVRNSPVVGSSGALFGLVGAALSELIFNWRFYTDKFIALASLLAVLALNLALGFLPYVDNFSSIGGFVAGVLLGAALLFGCGEPEQQVPQNKAGLFEYTEQESSVKPEWRMKLNRKAIGATLSILLFCLVFGGLLVLVLRGIDVNEYCQWCRYVDCVPTKSWHCEDTAVFCETMVSDQELTLTCLTNGKFRVFPYTNMSQSRMTDLCTVIC